jgi:hypothetical protein
MKRLLPLLAAFTLPHALHADPPRFKVFVEDLPTRSASRLPLVISEQPLQVASFGGYRFGIQLGPHLLTSGQSDGVFLTLRRNGISMPLGGAGDFRLVNVLPPRSGGDKSPGQHFAKRQHDLLVAQKLAIVPGYPTGPVTKDFIARHDTCLCTYEITNDGAETVRVEPRVGMVVQVGFNIVPKFLAPTQSPDHLLEHTVLDPIPTYLRVLERAEVKNPGLAPIITLKMADRRPHPSRVVLTNLAGLGDWEARPASMSAGQSALALYWPARELAPGERYAFSFAYGAGLAPPDVLSALPKLTLSGSFEPGKTFTISAYVAEPRMGQTLRLELPEGVRLLEGKELQPLAVSDGRATLALWRARVERAGEHAIRVHSSSGMSVGKNVAVLRLP